MESVETSKPGRLADLQFSVPRFIVYTILTAGIYYYYREMLFLDRIARTKTERNLLKSFIALYVTCAIATIFFMNSEFLENGFLLASVINIGWYSLMYYSARRLQLDWGYRMDLRWTFLFGTFYFQHKANQKSDHVFHDLSKWTLTYCSIIVFVANLYPYIHTTTVKTNEMFPTLVAGDRVRIDAFSDRKNQDPKVGDLVVFQDLNDKEKLTIGRVHAVPGQTFRINGSEEFMLASRDYYVLGDNKDTLLESNAYGVISNDRFVGKAERVLWSFVGSDIRWDRTRLSIKSSDIHLVSAQFSDQ